MSKKERAVNYVIVAEPASDTLKAALDLVKQQPGQDNLDVIYAASQSETVNYVTAYSPCLVMFSFLDSNDLVAGLSLLNAISAKVEQKEVKVIALTKIHNPKLLKVLEKQKVSVVISEPIAMRTLMFKLLLQIKSLDVIRKSIEQKIKQNEKIQFRNNAEDVNSPQDESAIRFRRAENAAQKNLIMSGEAAASDHLEIKTRATEPRETFQKVTTEEIKSSSMAVDQRDVTARSKGTSSKKAGEADPAIPAEAEKDSKIFTADKKTPQALRSEIISRSGDAIEESKGEAEAGEEKELERSSAAESAVRLEEKKKKQLEKKLERMREQKVNQIAREDRAMKSKEESATRAKLQTEENGKRERARGERFERQKAEKEKLGKAAVEESIAAADLEGAGRARPSQEEPTSDRNEARDPIADERPGVEPNGRPRSLEQPSEAASPAAAERKERPEDSAAEAKGDLSKSEKRSAKNLAEVANETKGGETESPTASEAKKNLAAAIAEEDLEPAESHLKREKKKREPKKAVSSYLEEMLRQSKTLNGPLDPTTGEPAEISTVGDSEGEPGELTEPGAQLSEAVNPIAHIETDADEKISNENETEKANKLPRAQPPNGEEAEAPRHDGRIGPDLATEEEKIGSFQFGEIADPSSWSDHDQVEKSNRAKRKRGFSDNFEEDIIAWNARGQKAKRAGQPEAEKIPEVLLAKSQITPDPGSWVKVGKFYVYCNDSLYSSPIDQIADALPLCVYEGETKPASRGIFWLFERQKPLIAEAEVEVDPTVVKFLGKFLRSKSPKSAEEKASTLAAASSPHADTDAGIPAGQKRGGIDTPEEFSSQREESQIPDRPADSINGQVTGPEHNDADSKGTALDSPDLADAPSVAPGELLATDAQAESEASGDNSANLNSEPAKKRKSSGIDDRIQALAESLEKQARELSESVAEPSAPQASAATEEEDAAQPASQRTQDENADALAGELTAKKAKPAAAAAAKEEVKRDPRPGLASPELDSSKGKAPKKLPALIGDLLSRLSRKRQTPDELIGAPILSLAKSSGNRQLPSLMQDRPKVESQLPRLVDSPTTLSVGPTATKGEAQNNDPETKKASATTVDLAAPGVVTASSSATPFAAMEAQAANPLGVPDGLNPAPPLDLAAQGSTRVEPNAGPLERWQMYTVSPPPASAPEVRSDPRSRAEEIARQLAKDQKAALPKMSRGQELALHMAALSSAELGSYDASRDLLNARARLEVYAPSLMVSAVKVGAAGEILVLAGECPFRDLTELRAAEDSVWAPNLQPGKSGLMAVAREGKRILREEERLTLESVGALAQSAAA